jgi:integral membrane protein (TIGR00529 family)
MLSLIFLLLIIVVIIVLIKFRLDIGAVLLIGAVLTSILFRIGFKGFFFTLYHTIIAKDTLTLVGTVMLILFFSALLEKRGDLSRMVDSLRSLIRDSRLTMVIPSAIIGLLPMPGGALMSAPMLKEGARDYSISAAEKTFLNYWFRHIWEYFWPLYPGLIVASAITTVPIFVLARFQFPLTLAAILAGLLFGLKKLPYKPSSIPSKKLRALKYLFLSIWHILIIIILVLALKIPVLYVMAAISTLVTIFTRMKRENWKKVITHTFSYKIILLLFSVMFLKAVLINTGAIDSLRVVLKPEGFSLWILLFIAPFIVGFLTGVNHAYVGVAFPILLPFFLEHGINLSYIMFAYASGFAGILLSPVHLCLVLTKEYYKADFNSLYKVLILPTIFVWLFAVLMFFLHRL